MIERIYHTNLDLRHGDMTALSKFDKLEETPAVGTRIQISEFQLEVCSVVYHYIDAYQYQIMIEVWLPKGRWKCLSDFQKWYRELH